MLLLAYVVGKLWLAGHNREPAWYDTAASAVVIGGAFAAAAISFTVAWRVCRRRSSNLPK